MMLDTKFITMFYHCFFKTLKLINTDDFLLKEDQYNDFIMFKNCIDQ